MYTRQDLSISCSHSFFPHVWSQNQIYRSPASPECSLTMSNNNNNNNTNNVKTGGTRIWVQASAVDAIRNSPSVKSNARSKTTTSTSTSTSTSTVVVEDNSDLGRTRQWGWMSGILLTNNTIGTSIQLDESADKDDIMIIQLSATALQDGIVVLGNEQIMDADNNNNGQGAPNDLITLTHLHEPAVVSSLQKRYEADIIYTATGPVLIALNPFKSIPRLYGEASMKRYWDKAEKNMRAELPPHVYQIADSSFRSMMRKIEASLGNNTAAQSNTAQSNSIDANQAILVSGESGAGKTVTTKFVMKYLAALSQRASVPQAPTKRAYRQVEEKRDNAKNNTTLKNNNRNNKNGDNNSSIQFSTNSIESKVLQSNPILESFGNARTIRNDNSSRFGKFIEIQFTQTGRLVGATIDTYLLEKVRLVTQSPGERNYHVFFEILRGMDANQLRQYYLAHTASPQDFGMLQSGTEGRRDGVSDKETYKALRTAMTTMNFQPKEQENIFSVTAALLHCSNVKFVELENDHSELDRKNIHLEPACQLLGITSKALNEALCTFSIQAGRDGHVKRRLEKQKAEKCLEALMKATYGAMFQYLVMRINDSIAYHPSDEEEDVVNKPVATIGVLDIFGFESFTTNSFEQLCINYCNEALQQQFNAFVLKNEQEEYEREGIEWSFIEFPENQDVLDLIDKRGSGILNILDDQCRAPGTTDRSFASDVYAKCTGNSRFRANRKQVALYQFEVHHYAGHVEYTTLGFVEKNRDQMHNELTELLANSTNPFVCFLSEVLTGEALPPPKIDDSATDSMSTPYKMRRSESSSMKTTVGGQFRRQLRELRSKIDKTSPHYVRCLKPNDNLVADHFDPVIVAEQLRCGGILEAVRVSRAGFPQHYPHAEFCKRYRCVAASVKDIRKNSVGQKSSNNSVRPGWAAPTPQKTWQPPRGGAFRGSFPIPVNSRSSPEAQTDKVNYKELCKDLLKIIARKMQTFEKEENKENGLSSDNNTELSPKNNEPPAAKAKSYSSYSSYSASSSSWSKTNGSKSVTSPPSNGQTVPLPAIKSRYQPWANKQEQSSPAAPPTPPARSSFNGGGGFRRGGGTIDLAKVGIQMGKTKVFLRHAAFETLERIRSRDLTFSATKLNAIFRMYLCRMAYVPVRDAFREELRDRGILRDREIFSKEEDYPDRDYHSPVKRSNSSTASHLISAYESEVRASIHNPVQRSEWGTKGPSKLFKWVILEGIWVKNPMEPPDGGPERISQ